MSADHVHGSRNTWHGDRSEYAALFEKYRLSGFAAPKVDNVVGIGPCEGAKVAGLGG
jgi:hypothetical protein